MAQYRSAYTGQQIDTAIDTVYNLAEVATSGDYDDLINKPSIPSNVVTSVNNKTGDVTLTASDVSALPSSTVIPSKTSDLSNDSNFVTSTSLDTTLNDYVKSTTTKTGNSVYITCSPARISSTLTLKTVDTSESSSTPSTSEIVVHSEAVTGSRVTITADKVTLNGITSVSTPTTDTAIANKKYVDDAVSGITVPVTSVNTKTGAVSLTASDVGALPSNTTYVSDVVDEYSNTYVENGVAIIPRSVPLWNGGMNVSNDGDNNGFFVEHDETTLIRTGYSRLSSSYETHIHYIVTPTANGDAANKKYVDDSISSITHPVTSVNTKTGAVTLTASDVGATTTSDVNGLIATAIGGINSFEVEIVQSLPTQDIDTHTIYMISNSGSGTNIYDEYMYINSAWEKIGTTETDLSGYVPTSRTINNKALSSDITLTAANVGAVPASSSAAQGNLTGSIANTSSRINIASDNIDIGSSSVDLSNKNLVLTSSVTGHADQTSSIVLKTISANNTTINNITLSDGATTITGVVTPTSDTMAANKKYVDDSISSITHPVTSVNTKTGAVVLTASDVGALPDSTVIPAAQVQSDWNATTGMGVILNKPTIPTVPTNVSSFTNDAGYLTLADLPIYNGEVS